MTGTGYQRTVGGMDEGSGRVIDEPSLEPNPLQANFLSSSKSNRPVGTQPFDLVQQLLRNVADDNQDTMKIKQHIGDMERSEIFSFSAAAMLASEERPVKQMRRLLEMESTLERLEQILPWSKAEGWPWLMIQMPMTKKKN